MSEQLFEEAKREVVRFLIEKHRDKHFGLFSRLRKKVQAVTITERQILNQFYGTGSGLPLQRYARTLETHPGTALHAIIARSRINPKIAASC